MTNAAGDLQGGGGTSFYFRFSIWDSPTVGSGNKLWPAITPGTATTTVTSGVFNVNIGDTANSYPDVLNYNFYDNADVYLQVEVSSTGASNSFETLSPRQRITAAGFAINANAVASSTPGVGANQILKLDSSGQINIGGNIITTNQLQAGASSTSGTLFSVNPGSSFSGNLIDLQVNSVSKFTVNQAGNATTTSLVVTGNTTLGNATTTGLTVQGGTLLGSLVFGAATSTSLTVTGGASLGSLNVTNLSALGNITAGNATTTGLTVSGGSSLGSLAALNISVSNATTTGLSVNGGTLLGSLSAGATSLGAATSTSLTVTGGAKFAAIEVASCLGCSGTTVSLQNAYNGSTSSPEILLNSTIGALTIQDTAAGIHTNIFEIFGQGATSTLFSINATSSIIGVGISLQNATTTGLTVSGGSSLGSLSALNVSFSNATTTGLSVSGGTLLGSLVFGAATSTSLTVTGGTSLGSLGVTGNSNLGNATTSGLTVQGGSSLGSLIALNSSFSNATSTGGFSVVGGTKLNSLAFTVGTSTSFGTTGGAQLGSLNVTGNTNLGNATTTGLTVQGGTSLGSLSAGAATTTSLSVTGGVSFASIGGRVSNANGTGAALNLTTSTSTLLFVRSDGRVGIGTTNPVENITVVSTGVDDNPAVGFMTDSLGSAWTFGLDRSDNWKFKIASSTALGTNTRFTIDGSGNVGIASTSPSAVLSVNVSNITGVAAALNITSATSSLLYVRSDGNIGIGSTTPSAKLSINVTDNQGTTVALNITSPTSSLLFVRSNGSVGIGTTTPVSGGINKFKFVVQGNAAFAGCVGFKAAVNSGTCLDVAESYPISEPVEAGDLVMLDQNLSLHIKKAIQATTTNNLIVGIVSTQPSISMNGYSTAFGGSDWSSDSSNAPVALVGRVPTKVSLENGPIVIGNRISVSSIAGIGKKASSTEATVGIALEPYSEQQATSDKQQGVIGKILVFVNLGQPQSQLTTLTAAQGTVDLATVTTLNSDLNLNGFSILNVKSISGLNGLWKIDEGGNIVAQDIKTQTISSSKGFTTYDEDTGQPYCIKIKGGQMLSVVGYCQDVWKGVLTLTTPAVISPASTPPVISSTTTPEILPIATSTPIIATSTPTLTPAPEPAPAPATTTPL